MNVAEWLDTPGGLEWEAEFFQSIAFGHLGSGPFGSIEPVPGLERTASELREHGDNFKRIEIDYCSDSCVCKRCLLSDEMFIDRKVVAIGLTKYPL